VLDGRYALSTPALFTTTRSPAGIAIVSGSVTSSAATPCAALAARGSNSASRCARIAHARVHGEAAARELERDRAAESAPRAGHERAPSPSRRASRRRGARSPCASGCRAVDAHLAVGDPPRAVGAHEAVRIAAPVSSPISVKTRK
jgi:hypothetical protein